VKFGLKNYLNISKKFFLTKDLTTFNYNVERATELERLAIKSKRNFTNYNPTFKSDVSLVSASNNFNLPHIFLPSNYGSPLTLEERLRRFKNNLHAYCGNLKHNIKNCVLVLNKEKIKNPVALITTESTGNRSL
jgi:hypothetical protein